MTGQSPPDLKALSLGDLRCRMKGKPIVQLEVGRRLYRRLLAAMDIPEPQPAMRETHGLHLLYAAIQFDGVAICGADIGDTELRLCFPDGSWVGALYADAAVTT